MKAQSFFLAEFACLHAKVKIIQDIVCPHYAGIAVGPQVGGKSRIGRRDVKYGILRCGQVHYHQVRGTLGGLEHTCTVEQGSDIAVQGIDSSLAFDDGVVVFVRLRC